MSLKNCTKSQFHGPYDTAKNSTCPWCDPAAGIKKIVPPSTTAKNPPKRLHNMTEEEILEAKIFFGLKKILKKSTLGTKINTARDYKTIFESYYGSDFEKEFEKEFDDG